MSVLNEMMLDDFTRWCLPENREENREYWSVECDIVKIEDIMVPNGGVGMYGNTVRERRYYGPSGGVVRVLKPWRGLVYLEPLEKNPLTLADVE